MDGKVLGVERRRRGNKEKARIVEETLMPDAVVCEVARRHGVAQSRAYSLPGEGRRGWRNSVGETARFCSQLRSADDDAVPGGTAETITRGDEQATTEVRSDRPGKVHLAVGEGGRCFDLGRTDGLHAGRDRLAESATDMEAKERRLTTTGAAAKRRKTWDQMHFRAPRIARIVIPFVTWISPLSLFPTTSLR